MQALTKGFVLFVVFPYEALEQETCEYPAGEVIQSDDFFNIPLGAVVTPGAYVLAHQKRTGDKFACKNEERINKASDNKVSFFNELTYRSEESRHAVYREHPNGGISR